MQFSIRFYPERVISYRVDHIYIINEPSLKRSKFWYFNISNETRSFLYMIWAQITIQYCPPYSSQCRFPDSFEFDFIWKTENCISSGKVGCLHQRWFSSPSTDRYDVISRAMLKIIAVNLNLNSKLSP